VLGQNLVPYHPLLAGSRSETSVLQPLPVSVDKRYGTIDK
jgi:hypothetical protein